MSVIKQGIIVNENGLLSFGDYTAIEKIKVNDFEFAGNVYKLRSHDEVTRLEKNGKLLVESVPGITFHNFKETDYSISFSAEGVGDTQVTLELEPETEYKLLINSVHVGKSKSNLSGKLSFSIEIGDEPSEVLIERI